MDEPIEPDSPTPPEPGEVARDLAPWASESRELLASLLSGRGLDHVWQGTTLVTRSTDEASIDPLIAEVEAAAVPMFDDDVPRVVYEVGQWPVGAQSTVASRLAEEQINHAWDANGDLIVAEADEAAVEAIFDEIDLPEDEPEADVDPDAVDRPDALTVMSELFLAADRLRKNALDPDGVLAAVEWSDHAEHIALPFGLPSAAWKEIVESAVALRTAIEGDDQSGDDQIEDLADQLRTQLRQYV